MLRSQRYDKGQYCYDGYGAEGRWSFWGETCIPRSYVETRWREMFEVCDYIDDRAVCPQNVIVVRKAILTSHPSGLPATSHDAVSSRHVLDRSKVSFRCVSSDRASSRRPSGASSLLSRIGNIEHYMRHPLHAAQSGFFLPRKLLLRAARHVARSPLESP